MGSYLFQCYSSALRKPNLLKFFLHCSFVSKVRVKLEGVRMGGKCANQELKS